MLRLLSYFEDNTWCTITYIVVQLILRSQTSLDMANDLPLVTKLYRRHKEYNVAILNNDPSDTIATLTSPT